MNRIIENFIKNTFKAFGLKVQKYDRYLPEIWSNVEDFKILFKTIENHTVVSQDRCFMIYQLAKHASLKEGDIAEVGVYKGGTGRLIAKTCPTKTVHLFDTFMGMPKTNATIDYHTQGDFSDTSLESVQKFVDCKNVVYHQGLFPETAQPLINKKFCFVYVDVDIYQSVKDCLHFFYERLVEGGIIVFDDYEWKHCPGVKKAIIEFLTNKPEIPIVTTRYQCILIKL